MPSPSTCASIGLKLSARAHRLREMSSEIERALTRTESRQPGGRGGCTGAAPPTQFDALGVLVEVNRSLSGTAELGGALRSALEVLNRHPVVARSAITLSLPDIAEVVVDAAREPAKAFGGPGERSFACATVVLDERPVGALAVDLLTESRGIRDRMEDLLEATAELIAQAVKIRQLLQRPPRPIDRSPPPPETASTPDQSEVQMAPQPSIEISGQPLAEMVSHYEKGLIEEALRVTRGNRAKAAKLLRTTERIVGYRVQQYGIDCRVFRD